jgi:hypothetical protein
VRDKPDLICIEPKFITALSRVCFFVAGVNAIIVSPSAEAEVQTHLLMHANELSQAKQCLEATRLLQQAANTASHLLGSAASGELQPSNASSLDVSDRRVVSVRSVLLQARRLSFPWAASVRRPCSSMSPTYLHVEAPLSLALAGRIRPLHTEDLEAIPPWRFNQARMESSQRSQEAAGCRQRRSWTSLLLQPTTSSELTHARMSTRKLREAAGCQWQSSLYLGAKRS